MKLPCELVQDLIALYEDNACSQSSRSAVEAHLQTCEECRGLVRNVRLLPEMEIEIAGEEKAAARSFRKIRRRWVASVLAVLVALPLLAVTVLLTVGQVRGEGICFTNLDDISLATRFVRTVCAGEYEKAARYLDHTGDYASVQDVLSHTPEEYMPNLEAVDIGGEIWLASEDVAQQYLHGRKDAMQTWGYLLFNGIELVLIPVEVWEEYAGQDPLTMTVENGIYSLEDGKRFRQLQTRWGDFLVTEDTWSRLQLTDMEQWCYALDMMPQSMYYDQLEEIQMHARQLWQSGQDWNAWAKDMSIEEYTACRNREFVTAMTACADMGITLEYRGIGDIYSVEGEWTVYVEVTASYGSESRVIAIGVHVSGGQVNVGSFYHWDRSTPWMEKLMEAVS